MAHDQGNNNTIMTVVCSDQHCKGPIVFLLRTPTTDTANRISNDTGEKSILEGALVNLRLLKIINTQLEPPIYK